MTRTNYSDAPARTIQIPDARWEQAVLAAAQNNETVDAVIRRSLREYVTTNSQESHE